MSGLVYTAARGLFRLIAAPMFHFRVHGVERVPRAGPGVVVAPHRSWLDPACVGGACPRPIRFLIMSSVYDKVWARWFYRLMRSLPVGQGAGMRSVSSLRGAIRALREGQLVGVFPEGRVVSHGGLGPIEPGAAALALHTGAPLIPMVICGSSRAWPHGRAWPGPARVSVHIGHPIDPGPRRGRAAVAALTRRIEQQLTELSESIAG